MLFVVIRLCGRHGCLPYCWPEPCDLFVGTAYMPSAVAVKRHQKRGSTGTPYTGKAWRQTRMLAMTASLGGEAVEERSDETDEGKVCYFMPPTADSERNVCPHPTSLTLGHLPPREGDRAARKNARPAMEAVSGTRLCGKHVCLPYGSTETFEVFAGTAFLPSAVAVKSRQKCGMIRHALRHHYNATC